MADNTLNNYLKDTQIDYSAITAGDTVIVDLGTEYNFRAMMISSSIDQPVIMTFTNDETIELEIPANFEMALDNFRHDSEIKLRYKSIAPTSGVIKIVSWRAE